MVLSQGGITAYGIRADEVKKSGIEMSAFTAAYPSWSWT